MLPGQTSTDVKGFQGGKARLTTEGRQIMKRLELAEREGRKME
jgi:molybdenum-dependent DNA-binding transcriptional regulator ModE